MQFEQQQPHFLVAAFAHYQLLLQDLRQVLGAAKDELLLGSFQRGNTTHQQRGAIVVGVGQLGDIHAHQGAGCRQFHGLLEDFAHASVKDAAERDMGAPAGGFGGEVFFLAHRVPGRRRLFEAARKREGQGFEGRFASKRLQ